MKVTYATASALTISEELDAKIDQAYEVALEVFRAGGSCQFKGKDINHPLSLLPYTVRGYARSYFKALKGVDGLSYLVDAQVAEDARKARAAAITKREAA